MPSSCSPHAIIAIALLCLGISANVRADAGRGAPGVLVIAREAKMGSSEAELINAVRDALDDLDDVRLLPPSPLDLDAVQLALDCSDESAQCLREIGQRMKAEIVIIPSLKPRRDALELHITGYERGASDTKTAMRRQAGTRLSATLLDAVPSMLREVLQLRAPDAGDEPSIEPLTPSIATDPARDEGSEEVAGASRSLPLGPMIVGGSGLALVAAGIVVGAMASSTEDDYAAQAIDTEEQAKRADDLRVQGENEALAANILIGTGVSALIAAGIWYLLDAPTEREPQSATVRPLLAPGHAGLVLTSTWGAR